MYELLHDLLTNIKQKRLVVMPLTRLLFYQAFTVGRYHFFPPGSIDLASLRPVSEEKGLRELTRSIIGFNIETLSKSPLVAFNMEIDWDRFLEGDHDKDIALLKILSSKAERALDIIRLFYCRLDFPNTLPGQVGSWEASGEYLGALLYSPEDNESYLIAGAAIESSIIVRGLGLELDVNPQHLLPSPDDGDVARFLLHGLSLYSDALNSSNETTKFIRVMTLFEFLASPDKYQNWKKIKGDIACHCAKDKDSYLNLCERFRSLTSIKDESGNESGLRTLIVHYGKLLPEILPDSKDRTILFRELQGYCLSVLMDMLNNGTSSWKEYVEHRNQIKRALGVVV